MSKPLKTTDSTPTECVDLNISIPCELADRIRVFADEQDVSLSGIVIEALDAFLRRR